MIVHNMDKNDSSDINCTPSFLAAFAFELVLSGSAITRYVNPFPTEDFKFAPASAAIFSNTVRFRLDFPVKQTEEPVNLPMIFCFIVTPLAINSLIILQSIFK